MSENVTDRHSHTADRPAEVTDPLLWRLALDVADAHAPAEDGGCAHLLCAGQPWPCDPWQQAQRALSLAQGGSDEPQQPASPQQGDWRTPAALPHWAAEQSHRESAAA
ncbi:hypothetical protein [Micromonospora sp. WMMD1082]|uniref:hypothetical protein n=1 Tax=Micromonospora sp. WMMD1082 TaxID=3016104 RepID=UPI0024171249|nr:hypothetical protein [Micromonospora sp. WMMD1082]MDG4797519.1 hypothetical protein [Micromonospora sp. WMMD1082]